MHTRKDFGCAHDPTNSATQTLTLFHSKEDEDILKAEYLINSKPDKAARLEIVRKVALGEKEVQVCPSLAVHTSRAA